MAGHIKVAADALADSWRILGSPHHHVAKQSLVIGTTPIVHTARRLERDLELNRSALHWDEGSRSLSPEDRVCAAVEVVE
jgi:hypothetical protein